MDGPNFRAAYAANLAGVSETLVRHFSEDNPETRQLVEAIKAVGQAVGVGQAVTDPDALYNSAVDLVNLIGEIEPAFQFTVEKFRRLEMAKMYASSVQQFVGQLTQPANHPATAALGPLPSITFADIFANFPAPARVVPVRRAVVQPPRMMQRAQDGSARASVVDLPSSGVSAPVVPKAGNRTRFGVVRTPANNAGKTPKAAAATQRSGTVAKTPANNAGNTPKAASHHKHKEDCGHCHLKIATDHTSQLQHAWKKHKDQVYKLLRPELVCYIDYCDYIGSSIASKKIHEGRQHNKDPASQEDIIQELEAGPCRYCGFQMDTLVSFKDHTLQCQQRDSRAPLGCTGCAKEFHFIYDFVTHLRVNGGLQHGKPVPLKD